MAMDTSARRNTREQRAMDSVPILGVNGVHEAWCLDIAEWLGTGGDAEPADIYVLGFQEVVPLNAGNVFGAEDGRPAQAWESVIRGALRRAQPSKPKYRCYSHPPSPSRFDPPVDAAAAAGELLPGGTDTDEDVPFSFPVRTEEYVTATPRKLSRLNHFSVVVDENENGSSELNGDELDDEANQPPPQLGLQQRSLLRSLSRADRVGLVWPEQPLDLLPPHDWNLLSSERWHLVTSERRNRMRDWGRR